MLSDAIGNLPQSGGAWVTVLGLNFANDHHAGHSRSALYTSGGYVIDQAYASASRTSIIAVTKSLSGWHTVVSTSVDALVNGVYDDDVMHPIGAVSSSTWVKFEFGEAVVVVGFKTYQQPADWGGTWDLQGSNDNFATSSTLWTGNPSAATGAQDPQALINRQSFLYYRFIGKSGLAASPYIHEVEFFVLQDFCQTISWSSTSAVSCHTYPKFIDRDYTSITVGALVGTGKDLFTFDGEEYVGFAAACIKCT